MDGLGYSTTTLVGLFLFILNATNEEVEYRPIVEISPDGVAVATVIITGLPDSEAGDFCEDGSCIRESYFGDCISGDCENYDTEVALKGAQFISAVSQ